MKSTRKHTFIMMITLIAISSCCAFKKGSWKPLPSCKHLESSEDSNGKNEKKTSKVENTESQVVK